MGHTPKPGTSPPPALRLLSGAWERLGGTSVGRWILAGAQIRILGRMWARSEVHRRLAELPDDVTVLIGVRNRTGPRIVNALRSIRQQVYPWGRVTALVIDYGSDAPEAARLAEVCSEWGAERIRVDGAPVWSRGRCLNVGLRRVRTKYVMTSDADLILSPHYLADAVATLRSDPLALVCSPMLDLPERSAPAMDRAARDPESLDVEAWRSRCDPRLGMDLHPSASVTFTAFHQAIRGYDEFYEGWGREDDDLMLRLTALGLRMTAIPPRSFYLHQWHPKFEGIASDERRRLLARNDAHLKDSWSVIRNDESWGSGG